MANTIKYPTIVKTFNMTFTGAFSSPRTLTFKYYWRDKNAVSIVLHPFGPFPQNSANVLNSTTPFPTNLIPIKELHSGGFGINDNGTLVEGAILFGPGGIQIVKANAPYTFSGTGVLGANTVFETTFILI